MTEAAPIQGAPRSPPAIGTPGGGRPEPQMLRNGLPADGRSAPDHQAREASVEASLPHRSERPPWDRHEPARSRTATATVTTRRGLGAPDTSSGPVGRTLSDETTFLDSEWTRWRRTRRDPEQAQFGPGVGDLGAQARISVLDQVAGYRHRPGLTGRDPPSHERAEPRPRPATGLQPVHQPTR